jgi:hypothetical protein
VQGDALDEHGRTSSETERNVHREEERASQIRLNHAGFRAAEGGDAYPRPGNARARDSRRVHGVTLRSCPDSSRTTCAAVKAASGRPFGRGSEASSAGRIAHSEV